MSTPRRSRGAVFISGCDSGIGLACARQLADQGFTVYAGVIQGDRTAEVDPGTRRAGAIIPVTLDVTCDASIAKAVAHVSTHLGGQKLVGIVNNAGVSAGGALMNGSRDTLAVTFDVNCTGPVMLTRQLLALLDLRSGRVINIGSTSARFPDALNGVYGASKAALDYVSQIFFLELGALGVKVSIVEPGVVATPYWQHAAHGNEQSGQAANTALDGRWQALTAFRYQKILRFATEGRAASTVSAVVLRALTAKRPRFRYLVGADARVRAALGLLLPQSLLLTLLRRRLRSRLAGVELCDERSA